MKLNTVIMTNDYGGNEFDHQWILQFYRNNYSVILVIILLIGSLLRLIPIIMLGLPTDIPYNGGGLYYAFSMTIQDNYFRYPLIIPYYSTYGIPFAYNPLVFYIIALLATITTISPFIFHIYLPTIFSILTIFAFWFFVRETLKNDDLVITSTFFYCILPQAFSELLPGEGLIESFGTLLFIVGIISLFRIYKRNSTKYRIVAGVLFGFLILGSPGGALAFGLSILIIPFFNEDRISAIKTVLIISLIGIAVSIPWWSTVIAHHGINTILNGVLVKHSSFLHYFVKGFSFNVGCEWIFGPLLCLLGIIYCIVKDRWLIPVWFIPIFLAGEIGYIAPILASILMAVGLLKIIIPSLNSVRPENNKINMIIIFFIILIFIHGIGNAVNYNTKFHWTNIPVSYKELRENEVTSLEGIIEIKDEINHSSRIFILGDYDLWWAGDWLPVLIKSPVINVRYGLEWTDNFTKVNEMEKEIIGKLEYGDIEGSKKIANEYGTTITHIFAIKTINTNNVINVLRNNEYVNVSYENEKVVFFNL